MAFAFEGNDRFQILRKLGEGGMGIVYEALDRERQTRVALKTLRTRTADLLLRFKREFREFQHINHPNLVSLGELYEDRGEWFFTMELVVGIDWIKYVGCGPTASEDKLRATLGQVIDALSVLHEGGKIHRDIKPSNVLVTEEGRAVLLDYGLATEFVGTDGLTSTNIVGTPVYMAPEQLNGERATPAADGYSIGVILYEMLTGMVPFQGPVLTLGEKKQRGEYSPPGRVLPGLPQDLCKLCARLLDSNPKNRPQLHELQASFGKRSRHLEPVPIGSVTEWNEPPAVFVGRREELAAMHLAFRSAVESGQGQTLLLYGESGVGKSATLEQFQKELRQADATTTVVLSGRCYEHENVPYKAIDGVVDVLSRYLSRLPVEVVADLLPTDIAPLVRAFPVLGRIELIAEQAYARQPLDSHEARYRVFRAFRELLKHVANRVPLVVVIDDMQWADTDSNLLLEELLHPPAPALLLLASWRVDDDVPPVVPYASSSLHLRGLNREESLELANTLMGAGPKPANWDIDDLVRDAAGLPFFVHQMARYAFSKIPKGPISEGASLEKALLASVGHLDEPSKRLLEAVAISPTPLEESIAIQAAELVEPFVIKSLKPLIDERLVRFVRSPGKPRLLEPYHDRIRDVVNRITPELRRAEIHRTLALLIEKALIDDPERLATHWLAVGSAEEIIRYFQLAGERADQLLAFDRAIHSYRICLSWLEAEQHSTDKSARMQTVRVKLAQAYANAGRSRQSADMFRQALANDDGTSKIDLRRRAADQLLRAGLIDEGREELVRVMKAFNISVPTTSWGFVLAIAMGRLRIRMTRLRYKVRDKREISEHILAKIDACWAASLGLSINDPMYGLLFHIRYFLMSLKSGEESRIANALAMEGAFSACLYSTTADAGLRLVNRAYQMSQRLRNDYGIGISRFGFGLVHFNYGNWEQSAKELKSTQEIFARKCTGTIWENTVSSALIAVGTYQLGRFDDLQAAFAEMRQLEKDERLSVTHFFRLSFANLLWLVRDEVKKTRDEAIKSKSRMMSSAYLIDDFVHLFIMACVFLYERDISPAVRLVDEELPKLVRSGMLMAKSVRTQFLQIRLFVTIASIYADKESILQLKQAEAVIQKLRKENLRWTDAVAMVGEASIEAFFGHREKSIMAITDAEQKFSDLEMNGYAAACCRRKGELIGGDEGAKWISMGDNRLRSLGVRNPEAFANVLAPGFPKAQPRS